MVCSNAVLYIYINIINVHRSLPYSSSYKMFYIKKKEFYPTVSQNEKLYVTGPRKVIYGALQTTKIVRMVYTQITFS